MAKITSKGQVTIPVRIRNAMDLEPGDDLRFTLEPDGLRVRVIKQARLSDLFASLPATRPYPGKATIRNETGQAMGKVQAELSRSGS